MIGVWPAEAEIGGGGSPATADGQCAAKAEPRKAAETSAQPSWRDLVLALTGIDLLVCPVCGERAMERRPLGTATMGLRRSDTS